jgi:hypothetical protein
MTIIRRADLGPITRWGQGRYRQLGFLPLLDTELKGGLIPNRNLKNKGFLKNGW